MMQVVLLADLAFVVAAADIVTVSEIRSLPVFVLPSPMVGIVMPARGATRECRGQHTPDLNTLDPETRILPAGMPQEKTSGRYKK